MASSIFQGQITKDTDKKRVDAYNNALSSKYNDQIYKSVDVSRLTKDRIVMRDGKVKEINPSKIAGIVAYMLDCMRDNKQYSFLIPYIKKPIIWTYEVRTACTDGIRIYMSPAFADTLIKMGQMQGSEAYDFWKPLSVLQREQQENADKYNDLFTKYVRFVVVHECYHILYNHCRRAILKYGSNPSENESDTGNISMDLEINRDIEATFPDLAGSTETINGIWFKDPKYYSSKGNQFNSDIWEEVWDDWIENKKVLNPPSNPFNPEGVNPKQKNKAQVGPYADGWRKAIDAIKKGQINPRKISF